MVASARGQRQGVNQLSYLELLAYLGMTRHLGGWEASNELTRLCQISRGKIYLDVGCGIGKAACARARQTGCRVVGIDLSPRMVEWATERARRERVSDLTEFRVADAQRLPFEDERFDAVITESVLSFVHDKSRALREFIRVTKPGGCIGLNESCWVKTPVPDNMMALLSNNLFIDAKLETPEYYQELLGACGLRDISVSKHSITARGDILDRARWFGVRGLLTNLYHIIAFSLSKAENRRQIVRLLSVQRDVPPGFYDYYGYAILAGRK